MHPGFAIGLVFLGCTSNVVFLELLVRDFPGCGNIVTFGQFLFIALEGFIFQARFLTEPRAIPLRSYFITVSMFFVVSMVNNYALNFNIPMPLHMIFRSGSLIASMVLGIIILKKRYTVAKYISIVLISLGIFICTFMSAKQVSSRTDTSDDDSYYVFLQWLMGIAMLTFALFMSARMGLFQEMLYKQYGKHSKEALFYNHFLPLPAFLLFASDIYNHGVLFNQSKQVDIALLGIAVPIMWFYLVMNVLTQYVCIRGVFILTTECTSLTVTLVVTLRKFISLIFSIVYFKNPFTFWHWIGTLVVFIGTLTYAEIWKTFMLLFHRKRKEQ
ncbi:UDP-xylose and UDP-N-acetylglucosamine transporter isoform X1 [Scyliorhinus canicula]|uniref:UDP-xylose and UDP-N-acetylglucosamine transporter isoform X1 n=1 Tax=Scyliorhinus canicula TaxID=7830 RepID=UPI0018F2DF23|nr:UDP-xylose and UDP-N-acetylglucosamine transporter isoform X1 [Scyliorhinus canicula]XP_038667736.1 UDP-xylose and UDP-N-acetylglucosamine transporter isoform X1 [Scyliorhinus canicula]